MKISFMEGQLSKRAVFIAPNCVKSPCLRRMDFLYAYFQKLRIVSLHFICFVLKVDLSSRQQSFVFMSFMWLISDADEN